MKRPVVLDNTVLANFALVGRADLVMKVWASAACITPAVLAEHQAGVTAGRMPAETWTELPVVTLSLKEAALAATLAATLGAGERLCLAVAVHRRGLIASDDLDARRAARRHGVPVTGTLGVLVLCVERGLLSRSEANAVLADMIAAGYHCPVDTLDPLLE